MLLKRRALFMVGLRHPVFSFSPGLRDSTSIYLDLANGLCVAMQMRYLSSSFELEHRMSLYISTSILILDVFGFV